MLSKLKVLNLSHSHGLTRTPDFSGLPIVERLIFEGCRSLIEVHHSIGQLERLVFLSLKDCKNLRNLPSSICGLKSVENLILCGCSKLEELPEELGNMRCLRELLVDMTAIEELPLSIGRLKNLRCLSSSGCKRSTSKVWYPLYWLWSSIREIPNSITLLPTSILGLSSLRELNVSNCNLLDSAIPSEIGSICSLQHLNMGYNKFCSLPASISRLSQLKSLQLQNCSRLQTLPEFPSSLKELDVNSCESMESLPYFEKLSSLQELNISYTNFRSLPSNIKCLSQLLSLRLKHCTSLQFLPELPSSLKKLEANRCKSMERLAYLGNLSSLQELDLSESNLYSLPGNISHLTQLHTLRMQNCRRLQLLPELPSSLEEFDASSCESLERLSNLGSLSSLASLDISESNICTLPACLGSFSQLQFLNINNCSRLQVLPELPSSLTQLFANGCTSMKRLSNVSNCHNLAVLFLDDCDMLAEIGGFENLKSVQCIHMERCNNLPNNFKKSLIQGLCGRGIFNIFLPGSEVPDWFSHWNIGSSVSFEVPPLLDGRIQGLTVCAIYTANDKPKEFTIDMNGNAPSAIIHNKTKGHFCESLPIMYTIQDNHQHDLWVAHIPCTELEDQLEHGDEIEVTVNIGTQFQVKKCGVNLVYEQDEKCSQSNSEAVIKCSSHLYADVIHEDNSVARTGVKRGLNEVVGLQGTFKPSPLAFTVTKLIHQRGNNDDGFNENSHKRQSMEHRHEEIPSSLALRNQKFLVLDDEEDIPKFYPAHHTLIGKIFVSKPYRRQAGTEALPKAWNIHHGVHVSPFLTDSYLFKFNHVETQDVVENNP
ncbi:hypothetical protein NE237_026703 [Protea cynaroides]|uniref:Uncharacterized protein n=1 Tax=Protea cynaroides TaxID=273540 RepID=A0A9Q0H8T0_9MAGN|nr:hypothetical protein NE237_026703 [Protea cynaroides]